MRLFSKIKFDKLKKFFKKLPRALAGHSLLIILALFFLSLIVGGLIFYKYVILVEKAEPQIIKKPLHFEEEIYQKISNEWVEREKRSQEADLKEYQDPFRGSIAAPPGELTP